MTIAGLRATTAADADLVRQFLGEVFGSSPDAPAFRRELIEWKYYTPRPDWEGSRSYVIETGGRIAAHGCVTPMAFQIGGQRYAGSQIIDWAAGGGAPGAGLLLRRRIEGVMRLSVAIGGSEDTRKLLPRVGYATVAQYRTYVRVVRPIRQFFMRPRGAFAQSAAKNAAKLLRNAQWRFSARATGRNGWKAQPWTTACFVQTPLPGATLIERSAALYSYLTACPTAQARAWHLIGPEGTAASILSHVGGQTRIADLQVDSTDPAAWHGAVEAATATAEGLSETCEIICNTSFPPLAAALEGNGYRLRGEQPVYINDGGKVLDGSPLHITGVDYDDYYSFSPSSPFVS